MPTDVNQAAEASAQQAEPQSAPALPDFRTFRDAENKRQITGQEPEPPKEESAASDKQEKTAASEDDKSKSEPAPESGDKPHLSRRKPDAEARISELTGEIKRLKAQLSTPPKPETAEKREPAPAQAKETTEPKEPNINDFDGSEGKTFEDYEKAMRQYTRDMVKYEVKQTIEARDREHAEAEAKRTVLDRIEGARKIYSDFDEKAQPAFKALIDNYEQLNPHVRDAMNRSDVLEHALYVMGSDPEALEKFVDLAKKDPVAAIEQFHDLQRDIRAELKGQAKAPKGEGERNDKGQFQGSAKEERKSAPPPPKEVSGRGTAPGDPVMGALEHNDFRTFRDAQNSRDLASRRG